MNLIKITDLTNNLGISSRSLRYYEQMGLIKSVRPEFEKYRFFDAENIERLKQIIIQRKMQIPIKDTIKTNLKNKIKKGELTMITKQSNNKLPTIHNLITMHYGENYWFNGCMKYLMECLGENDFDYWFFSGVTGDNLAQVYPYDNFRGCAVSDYLMVPEYTKKIFDTCGYEFTYVSEKELNSNKKIYINTLMAYIDKGIPVIAKSWKIICGYEEHGKTLLYMTSDNTEPEKYTTDEYIAEDWIFVGTKINDVDLKNIYRRVILDMLRLLTVKTNEYCFGAEAFRAWANDIESSKYDSMKSEEFDQFTYHTVYVCNVATNGSCRCFLERALEYNPDMTFISEMLSIFEKLANLWSNDLESIGGGFNITLETLKDNRKRKAIADKIREMAICYDDIVSLFRTKLVEDYIFC